MFQDSHLHRHSVGDGGPGVGLVAQPPGGSNQRRSIAGNGGWRLSGSGSKVVSRVFLVLGRLVSGQGAQQGATVGHLRHGTRGRMRGAPLQGPSTFYQGDGQHRRPWVPQTSGGVGRSKSSHTCLYVLLDSSTAPGGRDEERKGAREGGLGIRSPDRPFKVDDPTDCGRAGQRSARQGTKAMDDDTKQDKEESTPFLHSWRSGGLRGARERLWSVPAEGRNRKRCCFTWGGMGRENRRGSVFKFHFGEVRIRGKSQRSLNLTSSALLSRGFFENT